MWWKRKLDLVGDVFFRGALAPSLSDLKLERAGIEIENLQPAEDEVWAANLRHPLWGRARLSAHRQRTPPVEPMVEFTGGLTEGEQIVEGPYRLLARELNDGSAVEIETPPGGPGGPGKPGDKPSAPEARR